ncbi:MAG: AMP-dependent synthetase and ligase, partial [Rhodospirillaceae bacterium]
NRPEWLLADVAIMATGGITVPAYTTNTTADHRHILNDAMPSVAIVSTPGLAERLLPAIATAHHPPRLIVIEPPLPSGALRWTDAVAEGQGSQGDNRPDTLAAVGRDDTACIIYTSGTGGIPKGVMLSHRAILFNCMGACDVLNGLGLAEEVFLSFLPLSHSYEHTAGQFFPLSIGAQIYYAEGIDRLAANLQEVRPTLMTAVPRLYELLRARILQAVERQGGMRTALFHRALALGRRRHETGNGLTAGERFADLLLDRLVRRQVASRFGGRLKAMISGGAPLNPDVGMFFTALGLRLLQGYGQTEAAPVVSCNRPDSMRLDTVGPPLRGVTIRLAEDGEILVRGPLVMQGYWNQPEATRTAIDADGWLYTGDVGVLDDAGRLLITDRKKDIIVNSGGDNISPQRVEGFLTLEPEIGQAMVYGDRRPHLVALIVPDRDFLEAWICTHGGSRAGVAGDPAFRQAIGAAVARVNQSVSLLEKVRRFLIVIEPFSIANGMLTPTLKIRRHVVRQVYGVQLKSLYE